jgi:DNA-binding Lrp family transcriptional regulator
LPRGKKIDRIELSGIDRKLLKILLEPNGGSISKSSQNLATKLGVPLSTVRRRRKRLERDFLKIHYVLDIEKFGWRRVDFFISVKNGLMNSIAKRLMELDDVTYIGRSIGEHTIDLRVETIVKDNSVLLDLLEEIKGMEGVRDVVWSEIVSVFGRKISIPSSIIDKI